MRLGDTIPTVFSGGFVITFVLEAYRSDCLNLNEAEVRVNLLSESQSDQILLSEIEQV